MYHADGDQMLYVKLHLAAAGMHNLTRCSKLANGCSLLANGSFDVVDAMRLARCSLFPSVGLREKM